MDFCQNMSISGSGLPSDYPPEQVVSPAVEASYPSKLGVSFCSVDDLFPTENLGQEEGIEWLSNFVEDCLSNNSGNCINPPPLLPITYNNNPPSPFSSSKKQISPSPHKFLSIPGKARTKRPTKRSTKLSPFTSNRIINVETPQNYQTYTNSSLLIDPSPLLVNQQAYWLADSELIHIPKKENNTSIDSTTTIDEEKDGEEEEDNVMEDEMKKMGSSVSQVGAARRCTHCLSQRTPQWRAGPMGPKTLCNACGVRFKSGRLLPEYRPAKSPTFISYKHSNSHKKVLEMRMSSSSSPSSSCSLVDLPSSSST